MDFINVLRFIWFYVLQLQILPLFCLLIRPFYVIDAQQYIQYLSEGALQVKHHLTSDSPLIEQGYILANHRSWADFFLDPLLANSSVVGRIEAFCAVWFGACLYYADSRTISFRRGVDYRQAIFTKMKRHMNRSKFKRILLFPEGTRMKYTHLASVDEVKTYLKYGMLKCIYDDKQFPVQLQISSNKELVVDEKRLCINSGVPVCTHRSKSIHPNDFATEQEFYDEIANVWYECWKITHLKP
jgi:hypothetical protein